MDVTDSDAGEAIWNEEMSILSFISMAQFEQNIGSGYGIFL